MGGPCWIVVPNESRRKKGPSATDNFQVKPFMFPPVPGSCPLPNFPPDAMKDVLEFAGEPREWWSVEQCFQAMKFSSHSVQETIRAAGNKRLNKEEQDGAHGLRMWNEGRRHSACYRGEQWDRVKVDTMLFICLAKLACHEELQAGLLATGDSLIEGGQSTDWKHPTMKSTSWTLWNGLIQMYARELIRPGEQRNADRLKELESKFAEYRNGYKK